jgi:ribonucleoside-triphosphate reductase
MKKRCEVEVFSRVTGFYRPVQSWNKGKASEFSDRKKYDLDKTGGTTQDENSTVKETVSG